MNLPWLLNKKKVPDPEGHPLTGSSARYTLYDRFHEDNTKDKSDALRKMELLRSVAGSTARQPNSFFEAEQLLSEHDDDIFACFPDAKHFAQL